MFRAVADTHTVIWYLYDDPRLSPTARAWIEDAAVAGERIAVSTITLVEMVYLAEKGRIDEAALARLMAEFEASDIGHNLRVGLPRASPLCCFRPPLNRRAHSRSPLRGLCEPAEQAFALSRGL